MATAANIAYWRQKYGLPPEPESDAIWAARLNAGTHTHADMTAGFTAKKNQTGRFAPAGSTSQNGLNVQNQVAAIRKKYGLPPEPESDRIWVQRVLDGQATLQDAERRIAEKATERGVNPHNPTNVSDGTAVAPGGGSAGGGGASGGGASGGGGGGAPVDTTPKRDFLAEARGLYPWLTGQLLQEFAGFFAESGSATAALGRLRTESATYDRVFDGIKREDGSLRLNEAEYFSDKAGFSEVLREYGFNPASYDKRFPDLVRNEVRAQEFAQAAASGFQRFVEPGSNDTGLFGKFLDSFIDSGAEQVALEEVRSSSEYDKVFAGNRRDDGTLRMEEQEYFGYKRGWQRLFLSRNLNPEPFAAAGRMVDAIKGEVSIQELDARIGAVESGILGNTADTQQTFMSYYGQEGVAYLREQGTLQSALAMAIDPKVGKDLLARRITASQIGGEAAIQGFRRNVERAEELARAGVGQGQARELYAQAGQQLPGLSATTRRFNRGDTGIGDFEGAFALGDASQVNRLEGALREEQSSFTQRADTRRSQDGFGLSGLRQR